jgi:hypothetical protein
VEKLLELCAEYNLRLFQDENHLFIRKVNCHSSCQTTIAIKKNDLPKKAMKSNEGIERLPKKKRNVFKKTIIGTTIGNKSNTSVSK